VKVKELGENYVGRSDN